MKFALLRQLALPFELVRDDGGNGTWGDWGVDWVDDTKVGASFVVGVVWCQCR